MALTESAAQLREEIQKARQAETKAKAQIYTLRGKKGLQAMAAQMGEDLPPQLAASSSSTIYDDPEDSPQIQELRRQLALIKEMEAQQLEQIAELKAKKQERLQRQASAAAPTPAPAPMQANISIPRVMADAPQAGSGITLAKAPAPVQPTAPAPVAPAPVSSIPLNKAPTPAPAPVAPVQPSPSIPKPQPVQERAAPVPVSLPATPKTPVTKGKGGKLSMGAPQSLIIKILNASWDSGSVKSKKNNKVYTLQITMDAVTWKIIRGDDMLADLSKKMSKGKAEGSPLPPLVKKVVKRDQQAELGSSVETYLNQIQRDLVFAPKKDKLKQVFLKFFAPFSARDEGMGNFPGGTSDVEGWYIWKLGLGA